MLKTLINNLPKTSTRTISVFKKLDINTFWDLINYLPFRYEDYSVRLTKSTLSQVGKLFGQDEKKVTVQGVVVNTKTMRTRRRGFTIQKVNLDAQGINVEIVWFNQPYILRVFSKGKVVSVAGKVELNGRKVVLHPEEYEILTGGFENIHTGRLVPVYSETKGLSSRTIREKIYWVLKNYSVEIEEFLPQEIISYNKLLPERKAYLNIHFPETRELAKKSRERLAFDEIFVLQLSSYLVRKKWEKQRVKNTFIVNKETRGKLNEFVKTLPFKLTNDQVKAVEDILSDFEKKNPMNRFLQGDVGSGKTVVATIAMVFSYINKYQSVLMAPTEILATQHYETIKRFLEGTKIKIGIYTKTYKTVKEGEIGDLDIIVGTHALLNEKISFQRVGLVVIDEQHRFGVVQRSKLKEKSSLPHLLTMTATPIPRTVALTLYGELDISVIKEMPKGRVPVKTYLVPANKRQDAYKWIEERVKKHKEQVFVVCPLIEESDNKLMKSVRAVKQEYDKLRKEVFPRLRIGILHGKMRSKEKTEIMDKFKNREIDILVSTSVIEVGIDISNATIMMIETAERYGLAQLHQLRGRVGRGGKQSYCLLFTENPTETALKRLKFFEQTSDGMKLAEFDLKLRGPGLIYGTQQHGFVNLKAASLTDWQVISKSQGAVNYFVSKNKKIEGELKRRIDENNVELIGRD